MSRFINIFSELAYNDHFMKISIDIIIPSFRLQENNILPLLQLKIPADTEVNYFLIVDNPELSIPASIRALATNQRISLLVNPKNLGVAQTRNKGIEAGTGDWILFLDDDIEAESDLLIHYVNAVLEYPGENGFIGYVQFPPANTSFTKAIVASGSMDIFSVALRKKHFAWGATANTMLRRNAIGSKRFSEEFPKKGGGEDVDFFLNVRKSNGNRDFKTLPEAKVKHPWWLGENPDFKRPFRYGKGNSLLGNRHKENTYYDFLNTPETLLMTIFLIIIFGIAKSKLLFPAILFLVAVILTDLIANGIQAFKRVKTVNLKIVWYVCLLRFYQECGVLFGKLSIGQVWRMGERFHDDAKTKKIYFFRLNTYKITKWILYIAIISLLIVWYF